MTTSNNAARPRPGRTLGPAMLGIVPVVALLVGVVAVAFSGAADSLELADPGAVVRWGLPLIRSIHDLAAALTVGALLLGGLLMPEGANTARRWRTGRMAGVAGLTWGLAGVIGSVLAYADVSGIPLGTSGFWSQWWASTWQLEALRAPAITAAIALVVGLVALVERGRNTQAWLLLLSVFAMLPLALAGHSAGSDDHDSAVNSLAFHLVGVVLWVGGLLALLVMWSRLGKGAAATVQRFSRLAVWCYVFVGLSGVLNAAIRLGGLDGLATRYGALVLAKVACLLVLGGFGYLQRGRVVSRLESQPSDIPSKSLFVRLAAVEMLVMGTAIALGTTLARSQPPVVVRPADADPVLSLTGYPAPPPFEVVRIFTSWRTEWLFTTVAVLAIGIYLVGVARLHRRGDRWPLHRSICWVVGWLIFVEMVDGGVGIYGRVMFSVHMVEHMVIAMAVPMLLVLGVPISLALRTLPARKDNTLGPREIVLAVVHSRILQVLANPVIAAALFFFSLVVFYFSPLFSLALRTHTGHVLMVAHFLLTGYLFAWVLIGEDPGPRKWPAPLRLMVLLVTIAAHAFFGVALMARTTLLAPDFFTALQLPWLTSPLQDQQSAGAVAWGTGELPTLALAMLVSLDWLRRDSAEARRLNRQADRDGDADLNAYNEYLASMSRPGPKE